MHPLQDVRAYNRVDLHDFELFRGQLARFVDDAFRHCKLADVMQQRSRFDCLYLVLAQIKCLAQLSHVDTHAQQMIVRVMVLRLDSHGQALDCAHMQGFHIRDMLLAVAHASGLRVVGAVDCVDRRQLKERRGQAVVRSNEVTDCRQCRTHQVERQEPGEICPP